MEILSINCCFQSRHREYFNTELKSAFKQQVRKYGRIPINIILRKFNELDDYVNSHDDYINDETLNCLRKFGRIDALFLFAEMNIMPWDSRFHQLLLLIKSALLMGKPIFSCGSAAFAVNYAIHLFSGSDAIKYIFLNKLNLNSIPIALYFNRSKRSTTANDNNSNNNHSKQKYVSNGDRSMPIDIKVDIDSSSSSPSRSINRNLNRNINKDLLTTTIIQFPIYSESIDGKTICGLFDDDTGDVYEYNSLKSTWNLHNNIGISIDPFKGVYNRKTIYNFKADVLTISSQYRQHYSVQGLGEKFIHSHLSNYRLTSSSSSSTSPIPTRPLQFLPPVPVRPSSSSSLTSSSSAYKRPTSAFASSVSSHSTTINANTSSSSSSSSSSSVIMNTELHVICENKSGPVVSSFGMNDLSLIVAIDCDDVPGDLCHSEGQITISILLKNYIDKICHEFFKALPGRLDRRTDIETYEMILTMDRNRVHRYHNNNNRSINNNIDNNNSNDNDCDHMFTTNTNNNYNNNSSDNNNHNTTTNNNSCNNNNTNNSIKINNNHTNNNNNNSIRPRTSNATLNSTHPGELFSPTNNLPQFIPFSQILQAYRIPLEQKKNELKSTIEIERKEYNDGNDNIQIVNNNNNHDNNHDNFITDPTTTTTTTTTDPPTATMMSLRLEKSRMSREAKAAAVKIRSQPEQYTSQRLSALMNKIDFK